MPGQLLPLRILTSARSNFQSSRGISIFSKVFPFRLNEAQMYSTGSFRGSRGGRSNGAGGRGSEFSRSREIGRGGDRGGERGFERGGGGRGRGRGGDRGRFEGGALGGRAGQAKSLIEDEAELSDWVSELKTDSFNIGMSSDNDDDSGRGNVRDRDSGRGRDRDSGSLRSQRGGRGGGFGGSNRARDSESDDFDVSDRRSSRGAFGGSKRGRGSESDGFDVSDRRSSRGTFGGSKRGRGSESDDFDISDRRSSRGGSAPFTKGSRGSMVGSGSRRRDFDNDGGLDTRRRENDSRGAFSSMKRGGRGSDLSSSGSRGGGIEQKGRKQTPLVSDEDDDSDFGDLLSDIDSEEDSDEEDSDEDELPPKKKGQGLNSAVSPMKNSGRASDLSSGRSRGGGILHKGKQQLLQTSDDDEDENPSPGVLGFLNDEDSEEDDDKHVHVLNANDASSLHGSTKKDKTQPTPKSSSGKDDSYLSGTRFDQCAISPLSLKGIKDAGYEMMTVVQEATLPVILKGKDILAKARTGTGKTVAFLLPAIEAIVKSPPVDHDQKRSSINVLVICPTRELASQAAAEANKLLKYHPSIGVQIVIGGVRLTLEQKRLQANPCQILVATPGRLKDHIENTSGFATRLMGVKVLILDEADHLLDMGFRKDIEKIITAVPKQRQTLLFSATVPEDVRQICNIALKRDHEFINTVEEGSGETHAQVNQTHLVASLDKQFSLLYALLKDHIADDVDFKVLVFCTTAMVTRLVADLLSELKLNVREIHSRKPQSYRTRISDEFRKSKGLILVTSDVSARGVDYPDVTLVIQVGLPSDREQYIHRLGRTGRKGKEGLGVLLLAPWEESFLSSIKDLPITKASVPLVDPDTKKKVDRALSKVEMKNKEAAYQAWLGYYNSSKVVGRDKIRLVELANEFSRCMGLDTPPAINKLIIGKMGLKNVPGLRIK